ncbi:hypothetical protein FY534_13090 [Alicyclobacillus sp. TC]|uniref:Uncharacterized protein n=2 Tax=Alicyclobacillus tolerans TaxID=90970 RepID=A0ABT9LU45_9BACL|nr:MULTISPECIES: hypothetical protein [Alicyclobacillus]MDP9727780.1 hypothetical protein [Alicyclobacillus tengchongensis]QRF24458.1 hypothetical protein FY534_13090 [Alicyclobacillus sp. TC]SHK83724.1 hypothetical protein SAMN05443507_1241 [Alicyclobacillus montanus]
MKHKTLWTIAGATLGFLSFGGPLLAHAMQPNYATKPPYYDEVTKVTSQPNYAGKPPYYDEVIIPPKAGFHERVSSGTLI